MARATASTAIGLVMLEQNKMRLNGSRSLMDDGSSEKERNDDSKQKDKNPSSFFERSSSWKFPEPSEVSDVMQRIRWGGSISASTKETEKNSVDDAAESPSLASNLLSIVTGLGGDRRKRQAMNEIVAQARERTEQGDIQDTTSLDEVFRILEQNLDLIGDLVDKYIGDLDMTNLTPTSLFYYFEYEDERKNPSVKNRAHRFYPGIDIELCLRTYVGLKEVTRKDLAMG